MQERFPKKTLNDGRVMLNLACGTKTHWGWNNLDFSPYAYLAHRRTLGRLLRRAGILSSTRYERLSGVDPDIIRYDLRYGIPFEDNTFDVVYHSHFLEHLDRAVAPFVLKECHRVLKVGGVIRVVVPDLQTLIERYTSSLSALENGNEALLDAHLKSIEDIFEQVVRQEVKGTEQQHLLIRLIERYIRGNAAKSGELHRWMYDEFSLRALLSRIAFEDIRLQDALTSGIQGWNQYGLDVNQDGSVYKPDSLYMEGTKEVSRDAPGHLPISSA